MNVTFLDFLFLGIAFIAGLILGFAFGVIAAESTIRDKIIKGRLKSKPLETLKN